MSFRRFRRRLTETLPSGDVPWVILRTVDSTNSFAKRVAAEYGASGRRAVDSVFVAYHQSQGRGRGDHVWESPEGQGIYVSLLLSAVSERQLPSLPLLVGVGLVRGIQPFLRRKVRLRWPNDLLVGARKLGGVLIESMAAPDRDATVVVGFGVNHGGGEPPVAGATSIHHESRGLPPPAAERASAGLAAVTVHLIAAVQAELERLGDDTYAARRYAAVSTHRPGDPLRCRTPAGTVEGLFRGFDRRGFLRLETADGERLMSAGELIPVGDWR